MEIEERSTGVTRDGFFVVRVLSLVALGGQEVVPDTERLLGRAFNAEGGCEGLWDKARQPEPMTAHKRHIDQEPLRRLVEHHHVYSHAYKDDVHDNNAYDQAVELLLNIYVVAGGVGLGNPPPRLHLPVDVRP